MFIDDLKEKNREFKENLLTEMKFNTNDNCLSGITQFFNETLGYIEKTSVVGGTSIKIKIKEFSIEGYDREKIMQIITSLFDVEGLSSYYSFKENMCILTVFWNLSNT